MLRHTAISSGIPSRPGIEQGFYPERKSSDDGWLDKMNHSLNGLLGANGLFGSSGSCPLEVIHSFARIFAQYDDKRLRDKARSLRVEMHRHGGTASLVCESFALAREVSGRILGLWHHDVQLVGGWILIHGQLAEMDTGEGKSLTAVLAAATAAMIGVPVHVITVNDYLVSRDVELLRPVYSALGISVSAALSSIDVGARQEAYRSDIVYCTNKQIVFDYLRDRLVLGEGHNRMRLQLERFNDRNSIGERLFLQGLCYAIIDEADSVLIDEAKTPLIISQKANSVDEGWCYRQALEIARQMTEQVDYSLNRVTRQVELLDLGYRRFIERTESEIGLWRNVRRREEFVKQALAALNLYNKDKDYLVRNGKIEIIDEYTGRTMQDRSWEGGLHQLLEIKEQCDLTGRNEHLARITYQKFFRRYMTLAGMTGTAREVKMELWSVYRLYTKRVAPHRANQRKYRGTTIFSTQQQKRQALVDTVLDLQQRGQPVLIGTRTVAESDSLSMLLSQANIRHQVLNARQDQAEAEIIGKAGQAGCVTVATNMAGRGTDILLGEGVAAVGGLHVILSEANEAARIDRQLYGRCARQGDPGEYQFILSLDDSMLEASFLQWIAKHCLENNFLGAQWFAATCIKWHQRRKEKGHAQIRARLLKMDKQLDQFLSFGSPD